MKCLITVVLILSAAAAGFGQQNPVGFATGQSARLVIGQPEFDAELDSASQTILGGVSGLAYANKTLFVVDSNIVGAPPVNNRVMIYPTAQLPAPNEAMQYNPLCPVCLGQASLVLGQPDWVSILPAPCILPPANVTVTTTPTTPACLASSPQTPTATGMNTPTAVASDGTHLVVADTNNNRVLIWKSIPVNMNQPPDVVVGQTSFTTAVFPGDTPTATSLRGPEGVWIQTPSDRKVHTGQYEPAARPSGGRNQFYHRRFSGRHAHGDVVTRPGRRLDPDAFRSESTYRSI